ncbi:MAG: DNA internalization-related competence protein ComEC/Rec2 [Verrucomicrobiota bacterium]
MAWCLRGRRACSAILGRGIENYTEEVGLLRALMLGYRQEMSDRLYRAFSTTGTLHVVAISGMHVAVMGLLFIAMLKALGFSRQHWFLYLVPLLVAYTLGTGMNASALRAAVMAAVFWAAPLFRRKPDNPSALAMAALLILAFAPAQLFDLGFLFSFAAVAGLMVFYPLWMRPVQAGLVADPWRVQPEPAPRRWARATVLYTASILVASAAASLTTVPLTAYYFNMVSPVALLGNLVVIPLSSLVLLTGVLSLPTGWWAGFLAEVFNHANRVFIGAMLKWVDWMASVPGGCSFVQSPSLPWILFWYAAVIGLLITRGILRRFVLAAAVAAFVLAAVGGARDRQVTVDILDVGQGGAAFVNVPGGGDVLLDAGPGWCAREVARHLRKEGVDGLKALVLSHGDADHAGGAREILAAVPVKELWCAPFISQSRVCRDALAEARRRGVAIRRLRRGDHGYLGGGAEWEVLHPSGATSFRKGDEASLVLRVASGAGSVLFMNGGDGTVESAILNQPIDPAAAVLVVGNHGCRGTCSEAWLAAVAPDVAVISVGADNAEGHPDKTALAVLARSGVTCYRTDQAGDVRVVFGTGEGAGPACTVTASPRRPARPEAVGTPDRF